MKKFLTLLFILTTIGGIGISLAHDEPAKTQAEKNRAEAQRKKYHDEKVRKILCIKYLCVDGEKQLPGQKVTESTIDTNGCLVERLFFRNDSIIQKELHFYNDNFQRASVLEFRDGKMYNRVRRYEYTTAGLILQEMTMSPKSKILSTTDYVYDTEKSMIRLEISDSNSKMESTCEYQYAPDLKSGLCDQVLQKDAAGGQKLRVENEYNSAGSRITKKIFTAGDKLDYYLSYAYTPAGEFREIKKYSADGVLQETNQYEYNEAGFLVGIVTYDGKMQMKEKMEYVYYMPRKN